MTDKLVARINAVLAEHRFVAAAAPAQCACGEWGDSGPGENRVQHNYREHVADVLAAELRAEIPSVAFKGPYDTDVTMLRGAAAKLDTGYPPGGGNVTYAVSRLLRQAAIALEGCSGEELETRANAGRPR